MKTRQGFSLLELTLYIALFSIVIVTVLTIVTRSLASKSKALAIQEVEHNARYVITRITSDVRSASDIDETNFASNILSLTMPDGDNIEYELSSNAITIERNGGGAVNLTNNDVSVDTFSLENNTSFGTEYKDISVTIEVTAGNSATRPEFQASTELTSTMSLRQ